MIRKAVIPAAGFGTRFLPATKSQPKEMLPIVDTPVIQYVVEEAVAAGISDLLMIIGKGKRSIEEHFDRSFQLEAQLLAKGKTDELDAMRRISELAEIHFVWQKEMRGLGDAVYCARHHVHDEPFVVLLGDTLIDAPKPAAGQLVELYEELQAPVILVEEVEPRKVHLYGIIDGDEIRPGVYRIRDFVEKPSAAEAPSNLAIAGRYLLTADIFGLIGTTGPDRGGEIQLTDALRALVRRRPIYGLKLDGRRCDIGNKDGFIRTNIEFALKRQDMAEDMVQYIKRLAQTL
ncbi:MAG: UTP--glucose-1-phosphate uridylyltransferase GalU [Sedimentisphaerales bacterium]|jgi:UTP--glucose-1-phosphate uridylyltransferase|nr:UTP--glucose-1-phosphate uridylyltransferase GalU [Sedimentisphaerales bacterium]HNY80692.1 UTP--glucose-1-phosphate uridylyltransferase GalU [Sedimentisphaerales bacterium]HOC64366.1 UTP--glucose-1-phosphate uridylyltransferase GalU [Sedimentisphaerales bacterium]HOH66671.1 UTP--glucose-1-phosphate uridylyltransferase GalU [Sedimentisphaerales bacterium]HPY49546.1 UTP--glucose-1-phosphate uridylyltransferase GalU [Sedimentisphaerales bacterium]